MRKHKNQFYIKNDLAAFANDETVLTKAERDMDALALTNKFKHKQAELLTLF